MAEYPQVKVAAVQMAPVMLHVDMSAHNPVSLHAQGEQSLIGYEDIQFGETEVLA